ncbi:MULTISPECIES: hypothetical protein [Rhodobacterales]|jgi:hypothetical protein|uniref:Uncharacterized protein n=2 Tax=Rhodobacterales TaxID=204455 RepID=A0A1P8QY62_9RHOB|nr:MULTISPECIES: hypothetical protein [Rhodobacterales]MAM24721.1 hypothetical protein [Paracoccaceae bacterium]OWU74100.1 hypothetical protein ATO5_15505 [Loktanella sp. 22II-4b]APX91338.1 hypothetical protein BV394_15750 [Brevirhabdus pacifica]KRS13269.1 hypothetical protein XM52_27835 [Roseovarius indicus]MCE8007060.1 hypothetical protein [Aestuariivita sp.]|tara:strand:- start:936 stop:1247 length:312 start_codon:yes stop_codon:yes gene_type:complete
MDDDETRATIAEMLASGLETEVWPRAGTSEEVNEIVARLQVEAGQDLEKKLVIAGFTDHTIEADEIEQPCETCMYYKVHAKFCELPELMVPVEPEWSCRLWRI